MFSETIKKIKFERIFNYFIAIVKHKNRILLMNNNCSVCTDFDVIKKMIDKKKLSLDECIYGSMLAIKNVLEKRSNPFNENQQRKCEHRIESKETLKVRLRLSASWKSFESPLFGNILRRIRSISELAEWMKKCLENLMDSRIKFDTEDQVSIESSEHQESNRR